MSQSVNYSQIHAYMLKKTQEYYKNPPDVLIQAVIDAHLKKMVCLSWEEARQLVSPIEIQRLIKKEMQEKWPEFMSSIPSNPIRDED